jgi:hypothetical protein
VKHHNRSRTARPLPQTDRVRSDTLLLHAAPWTQTLVGADGPSGHARCVGLILAPSVLAGPTQAAVSVIADLAGLSTSATRDALRELVERGWLERTDTPGLAPTWAVPNPDAPLASVTPLASHRAARSGVLFAVHEIGVGGR